MCAFQQVVIVFSKPALMLDRFFLALEKSSRPTDPECCVRLVVEGTGQPDEWALRAAVTEASLAHPGSRLVLRGRLGRLRWEATDTPVALHVIDQVGDSDLRNIMLSGGFDFRLGPTVEVLFVRRPAPRLIVAAHHSVMDGRGVMTFTEDIFRCLRGETPLGAEDPVVYSDLAVPAAGPSLIDRPARSPLTVPAPARRENGFLSLRHRVRGPVTRVLPAVLHALAGGVFRRHPEQSRCYFLVPADLRPLREGVRTTGNLASALRIEVRRGDTTRMIAEQIRTRLADGEPAAQVYQPAWLTQVLSRVPLSIIRRILAVLRWLRLRGWLGFMYSASVSNVGRMPLDAYRGAGFRAATCYFIPPAMSTAAMLVMLTGNGDDVEVTITAPKYAADPDGLRGLLASVEHALKDGLESATVTSTAL